MSNYKYPTVEDALNNSNLITFADAAHSVFTVNFGNTKLVYKSFKDVNVPRKIKKILRRIDSPINRYFASKVNFMNHIDYFDNTFDIESKILEYWNSKGISSIHILEKQDQALVFKYFDAITFEKLLQTEDHKSSKYTQLLDVVSSIRDAAKAEGNSLYLHPDLLPKNFLYLYDNNQTIAIDPGLKLKDLSFEELDAKINLSFLYHLNKFDSGDGYMDKFLERLQRDEIKNNREFNNPLRSDVAAYLNLRMNIVTFLKRIYHRDHNTNNRYIFAPSKTNHINEILDKHI